MPSGDVITRLPVPLDATATNKDNSGDQQTLFQKLSTIDVLAVQLIPFGDVITRLPVPVIDTATNNDSCGDQQTLRHSLSAADVLAVHVMPSGDVITRLLVPVPDTATNSDNCGDQQTLNHSLSAADALAVQVPPRLALPSLHSNVAPWYSATIDGTSNGKPDSVPDFLIKYVLLLAFVARASYSAWLRATVVVSLNGVKTALIRRIQ